MRTFIAIELTSDIKEHLGDIARHLRRSDVHAGWVRPENYHLTLKFLGEIDESLIPPLTEKLNQLCQQHNAFTAELCGLGFFPTAKHPRILYAAFADPQPFLALAQHLEQILKPLGFVPEQRFHPHITLARIKTANNLDRLRQLITDVTLSSPVGVRVVGLFSSELHHRGVRYQALQRHWLRTAAADENHRYN